MKASRTALWTSLIIATFLGCAEGPLWKTGSYLPWARDKWLEEEQLADTLFERERELNALVEQAKNGSDQDQTSAAKRLGELVQRDPVLLMRLHAVKLLGQLSGPQAIDSLQHASRDPDSRVRIAAISAWKRMPAGTAVNQLHEIIGSDTNVDVRLAATRALGDFSGSNAINALSIALSDSNPAIQYRATESLGKITGERIGADVATWQSYVNQRTQQRTADGGVTAEDDKSDFR